MVREMGNISVQTENIFPIIKKWLYSDKDIFVRELVSNGCDAVNKLKKLAAIGEAKIEEETKFYVKVVLDKDKKTLSIIDNGIGMTEEEVKKYINQIAFSGAQDFIEKYKDKVDEGNQIIGHFGLGFYSAFMVSGTVQIDTLSFREGAEAVRWTCTGGTEYEMDVSDRTERGTTITLYMAEDSVEFLEEFKLREVLLKYCSFLPIEIYLDVTGKEDEGKAKKADAAKETDNAEGADAAKNAEEIEGTEVADAEAVNASPIPINDTHPLWLKNPKDCTDEEYKDFYHKVFHDFNDPLFWIHLNMDYPFNFKGILYFPKLKHEFESIEGQIKLYNNQVFVADNIKEIIPEFLLLLKGVMDCPDLPLNVSRSFLQNDGYVTRISNHITKKVGDKLTALFENEREIYNKFWDDIKPFVKYGCMREAKFYDRVKDIIVYKTINGKYQTLKDYLEKNQEKHKNKVFYVTDENQQAQYIRIFKEHEMDAVILDTTIDSHFAQFMETKETEVKFARIDSDLAESLKSDSSEENKENREKLEKLFKEALKKDTLKISVENLKDGTVPAIILLSEQSRRMQEMSYMFRGMDGMNAANLFPEEQTLVLNENNPLIRKVAQLNVKGNKQEETEMICQQVYDLAMMGHKPLSPEAMTMFLQRSSRILEIMVDEAQI